MTQKLFLCFTQKDWFRDKAAVVSLFLLDDKMVFISLQELLESESDSQPTIRKHMVYVVTDDTKPKDFRTSLELDNTLFV